MRLRGRLDKLETETVAHWREAWEQHAVLFDKHTAGFMSFDLDDLARRLEAACPRLSGDEQQAEIDRFLDSLGITAHRAFTAWFGLYDVHMPEADPPDLSRWPHAIPMPPDEPPGDWEKVKPYLDAENVIEQLGAQGYTVILGVGRAVREERELEALYK